MSITSKAVSFEIEDNGSNIALAPITDAKVVQYHNQDLTVTLNGENDTYLYDQPCVNVKDALDALTTKVNNALHTVYYIEMEFDGTTLSYINDDFDTVYGLYLANREVKLNLLHSLTSSSLYSLVNVEYDNNDDISSMTFYCGYDAEKTSACLIGLNKNGTCVRTTL